VRVLSSAKPALLDRGDSAMRAAALAFRKSFGSTPVFLRSGGTFPVVSMLRDDVLGANTVLMGFALPDDKLHGPNEKFHLPNFYKGIAACIWFLNAVRAEVSAAQEKPEAERSMAYGD
jgi:acetylornithine deacetylase/succinyl-diaminopimelate desuccinylase-like protein